jgi:SAM-dependent methyltransferase
VSSRIKGLVKRLADSRGSGSQSETDGFRLSEPLSDDDIRRLYDEQVLSQEFYGDAYVPSLTAFVSEAAEQMAAAIAATLAPRRVLDVGCGLGQLVYALRRQGVDAVGCDYSESFLQHAPEEVRPHLHQADVSDLSRFGDGEFDLVVCMEVLEHLPVDLVHRCVRDLARISAGPIVVTTPSFGQNWPGRAGLPLNAPEWRADALEDRRFSRIVLAPDGRPHHGHLTLATYRWWTALFASHCLGRSRGIENAWLEDPERPLWHHRWNLYVLNRIETGDVTMGDEAAPSLDHGWYEAEAWDGRPVRWTARRAALTLKAPADDPFLGIEVWGGPEDVVYPRELEVAASDPLGRGMQRARLLLTPGKWARVRIGPVRAARGDVVAVTLTAPEPLRPALHLESPDERELGVAVHRVRLTPEPAGDEALAVPLVRADAPTPLG